MKKVVTTIEAFTRAARRLEDEMGLAAHIAEYVATHPLSEPDTLDLVRVLISQPRAAPARGRGERVVVDVATMWNAPPFGTKRDHSATCGDVSRRLRAWKTLASRTSTRSSGRSGASR